MARDIRNVNRGSCESCKSCSNFISVSGRVLCDYCGCPPAQHQQIPDEKFKRSASNDDDDRLSSPEHRSSLSDGEMVDDCPLSRAHGFRSDPELLNDTFDVLDILDEDVRGRKVHRLKG